MEHLPKIKYYSLTQLIFGAYAAVAYFNMGKISSIVIYERHSYTMKQCAVNSKRLFFGTLK
jgi:hypothetical protein